MNQNQILEKLKGLDPKQLYAVLAVAILIVLGADIMLIARSQWGGVLALDKTIAQMKADIKTLQDNKARLSQFRTALDDMRLKRKNFDRMVHRNDDVPAVLKAISSLANEYGVKIDQLVPQKQSQDAIVKNEDGAYSSLAIFVSVRSGYHDFGRFMNRMEQERLFWKLEEFSFAADPNDPQKHQVKMTMKILVLDK
jgi:Tfp pilus assembly protein PilO